MLKELLVTKVFADPPVSTVQKTPIEGTVFQNMSIGGLFAVVTNVLIMIGLGLVLVFLALGFIKFITSQGDKVAAEQAQKWVTYAVLGGVGLFAVFAVKQVILGLVGGTDPIPAPKE